MDFLEVRIEKSAKAFLVYPVCKPSTLHVPWLSKFSAHVSSIHNSWPVARLKARLKLCSHHHLKVCERNFFAKRARHQFLSNPAYTSLSLSEFDSSSRSCIRNDTRNANISTRWLVLPHFPAMLKTGFASRTSSFWNSDFAKRELGSMFPSMQIRVSWKNVLSNVAQYTKSCWKD